MIEFSMAVSRKPMVGNVLTGQVTGHPTEKDGEIIQFGPIVKCIALNQRMFTVTDLNNISINVLWKDPPKKRLSPPRNYERKNGSIRPNWKKR